VLEPVTHPRPHPAPTAGEPPRPGGAPAPSRPDDAPTGERWHVLGGAEAAERLDVDPGRGLEAGEVAARLARHGRNELAEVSRRPPWQLFVDQFRNVLIAVLVGAAVLAGLVGDFKDTIVITVVLLINAVLGFVQENRAERSLAALRQMLVATARARRHGVVTDVPAAELVPGDVVLVEAGDRVPADGRIVAAHSLEVDESSLTGESSPVPKGTAASPADAPLADRAGMAYMNTVVTRGRGEVVVTATGMGTEIGHLAGLLQATVDHRTPLQEQLHVLGKRLAVAAGVAVAAFFALGLLRGGSVADTVLSSVALAVAAIPEGLPAVVTVTLAVGVHQMAKRGAIVKRLSSVETLGATTVICSDKTGTLTLNQMTARAVVVAGHRSSVSGEGYGGDGGIDGGGAALDDLLEAAVLCNDSRIDGSTLVGDPTEGALVALASKAGFDADRLRAQRPRLAEVPFDSARKLMVTFHREGDAALVVVKGAPDVLLERCATTLADDGGERVLDAAGIAAVHDDMEALAAEGLRVLAVARGTVPAAVVEAAGDELALMDLVDGLCLLGLVGLLDPPRPEARTAISVCRRAGIDVKMITGDHAATATSIARQVGIEGRTMTGAELDQLDDVALAEVIEGVGVFARVAPEHKIRLVSALQAGGHVVAMTGDGVNDAPALKGADIGIAMGITGTEVSKEAADMVLTDDDFATIVRAVEAGRTIYDNILKFVRFQLSTNAGAIFSLLGAQLLGLPVPFTAIQVLWVNLIMDGPPAMALGVDPPASRSMDRAPRRGGAILTRSRLSRVLVTGSVMAAGTLGVLSWQTGVGSEDHALAMAFTTFVFFQVFNVFNARDEGQSVFHRDTLRNGKLWVAVGLVVVLQVLAVHLAPVQGVFGTTELTGGDWLAVLGVSSTVLWVEELRKLVARRTR
jgi:Ca2+-transporting ATPase